MAAAFSPQTPILCYGPRAHVRPGRRRFLLWPAWMFRVLAPRPRERTLNILQRAVLGLCQAGIHRATEVGARLAIAEQFAAHLLRELQELGALSLEGQPTPGGREMLEEDTFDGREVVSGYVFQDPWTRELWPRMVMSEEPQAVEYPDKSKGYPRLLWGTRGSPSTEYAHLVFPEAGLAPVTPRPEHILQASVQQSRRARRNTLEPSAQEELSLGSPSYAPLIDRTALIETAPRAVFLVTYLYLPAESERGSQWHVCDPFGFGASPRLRSTLEQRLRTEPSLVGEVRKLYGEAVDDAEEGLASSMALLEREARFRVQERLGLAMRHPSLLEALVRMESAHGEVLTLRERCPPWKLEGVLVEAQKGVEHLLMLLRERHPPRECWRKLTGDRESNALLFERIAFNLGFKTPLPRSLARVDERKVVWAAREGGQSLRPHLLAALLTASIDGTHPLHAAARTTPELLERLDALATARDTSAAHARRRPAPPLTAEQLLTVISTVYEAVEALHGRYP